MKKPVAAVDFNVDDDEDQIQDIKPEIDEFGQDDGASMFKLSTMEYRELLEESSTPNMLK